MPSYLRRPFVGLLAGSIATCAVGQQPVAPLAQPQQPAAQPAQPQQPAAQVPAIPPQFVLNQIEQAYLDQVLALWETESAKVNQFQCPFERWEYNNAFGPANGMPLTKEKGELSYRKPDKGSFQITEISKWQAIPVPAGQAPPAQAQGQWAPQPNAIGEHWVCDGQNVYEYRQTQKQLVVRPIPPAMQGKAIVDGPLPFLFGAEAAKLKARYRMRVEQQPNNTEIWIQALPMWQADAADYRSVEVILDKQRMLPKAMQLRLPNNDRHVYMFDLENASVNGHLQRIMALFEAPRTPFGWKRVVEQPPVPQPQQPLAPPSVQQAPLGPGNRQAAEPGEVPR